ncbi:transposase [Aquibacillus kalidii]|uniref:transposase n=1 Tax=Aquibacillus kalidii TaxID=2762597 RepID=UPI001644A8A0|nr:transposase [Aquibacillus kalidii]
MVRQSRKLSYNGMYHLMLRGINRQVIFEDDQDRIRFLDTLKRFKEVSGSQIYGYCLMDNHIHLLMKEIEETVSKVVQRISSSYVYWYNNKYDRCGHLFQDRFKSEPVEDPRYFLTVLRYIHQNPVKAGLSSSVFESNWTSIVEYLANPQIVDIDLALTLFSSDNDKSLQFFKEYMQQSNNDICLESHKKVAIPDADVIKHIEKLGIEKISTLQQLNKKSRDALLAELKKLDGVTIRQLSRVTGISKSVIDRIG